MRLNSIMLSISILTLAACGQAIPTTNGGGGNAPDSFKSRLGGSWKGEMTNKTVDIGSALRNQTAEAEFKFKNDAEGSFSIKISNVKDASVEGTFVDFAGKSLHLSIDASTISTIGVKDATTVVNYLLIGANLELTNDRIDLQLIKTNAASNNSADNTPKPPQTSLVGQWRCTDNGMRIWSFKINDTSGFTGDIENQNRASVWIKGKLNLEAATVTESADSDNIGMRLKLQLNGADQLQVSRYESKDPNIVAIADSFFCTRQ